MDRTLHVAEVPAVRGAAWFAESFRLFRANPLAWIGLCAGWIAITLALLIIPFLGGVLANVLQPVFFASFAIAAYRQSAGEPILMGNLFAAFRHNARSLVALGSLMLMIWILVIVLMVVLGLPVPGASDRQLTFEEYRDELSGKEWILVAGFGLMVLVKGAFWFAPQLIAFHGMSVSHALRWSVYAALSNVGAMLTYGVTLGLLLFVAAIPWALGLVVVIPLMAITTFVGYREVFEAGAVEPAPTPP